MGKPNRTDGKLERYFIVTAIISGSDTGDDVEAWLKSQIERTYKNANIHVTPLRHCRFVPLR